MNKQEFIAKILRLISLGLENDWTLEYLIENIERNLENFRMTKS